MRIYKNIIKSRIIYVEEVGTAITTRFSVYLLRWISEEGVVAKQDWIKYHEKLRKLMGTLWTKFRKDILFCIHVYLEQMTLESTKNGYLWEGEGVRERSRHSSKRSRRRSKGHMKQWGLHVEG